MADVLNFGGTVTIAPGSTNQVLYPAVQLAWDISAYDSLDLFFQILGYNGNFTGTLKIGIYTSMQNRDDNVSNNPTSWAKNANFFQTSSLANMPLMLAQNFTRPLGRYMRIGIESGTDWAGLTSVSGVLTGMGRKV